MERGYWEIVLQPIEYVENKFDFTKLTEILGKHQVRYRKLALSTHIKS